MVESENRQLLSSIKCQDAVVFAAGSCSDEIQQRVARLFEQLQARSLGISGNKKISYWQSAGCITADSGRCSV